MSTDCTRGAHSDSAAPIPLGRSIDGLRAHAWRAARACGRDEEDWIEIGALARCRLGRTGAEPRTVGGPSDYAVLRGGGLRVCSGPHEIDVRDEQGSLRYSWSQSPDFISIKLHWPVL